MSGDGASIGELGLSSKDIGVGAEHNGSKPIQQKFDKAPIEPLVGVRINLDPEVDKNILQEPVTVFRGTLKPEDKPSISGAFRNELGAVYTSLDPKLASVYAETRYNESEGNEDAAAIVTPYNLEPGVKLMVHDSEVPPEDLQAIIDSFPSDRIGELHQNLELLGHPPSGEELIKSISRACDYLPSEMGRSREALLKAGYVGSYIREGGLPAEIKQIAIWNTDALHPSYTAGASKDNFLAGGLGKEEQGKKSDIKPLFRGVWAEQINNGDEIPVGGHILEDQLDVVMEVDTDWMEDGTQTFTRERVDDFFRERNGDKFKKMVEDKGINLDPETLHMLVQVQSKTRALLGVSNKSVAGERHSQYYATKRAKLSDFVDKSECAEQAVVGKLLLDKIGVHSVLMEGVHVDGKEADANDHTFLVLDDSQGDGSLIFDIARPKASLDGLPRVLRTDRKLDYPTFQDKKNYVVPAKDVYNGTTLYYGVGRPSLISMDSVNFAE